MMRRIEGDFVETRDPALQLQIAPGMIDEYVAPHTPVWPEMLAEIAASGRREYLAASPAAARWEASMAEFLVGLEGRADQAATPLVGVFNLQDQRVTSRS